MPIIPLATQVPGFAASAAGWMIAAVVMAITIIQERRTERALEALREAWHGKRMTSDDIWHYAKVCRVANVMRPYLESLA